MNISIILLDLDETLLHTDKTISEYTINVLHECQKNGILVGFSTSRGYYDVQKVAEAVKPDIIISSGGAFVYYKGNTIFTSMFSAKETKTMMDKALELTNGKAEITIDTVDKHYWNRNVTNTGEFADWGKFTYLDPTVYDEESLKLCVDTADPEVAKQIAESITDCVCIKFSDIPWYKFSKKNATKEAAIKYLSDYLNISCEEMIAFGDDFSDIGMLKMCGIGIAMENAIPEVKAISDAITKSNNEDGVGYYLEHFVLKTN